jgi:hypothetical protein
MTRFRARFPKGPSPRRYRPVRGNADDDDFDDSIFLFGFADAKSEIPVSMVCEGQAPGTG